MLPALADLQPGSRLRRRRRARHEARARPAAPGVFTAAGMLAGRLEHHFLRPFGRYLDGPIRRRWPRLALSMRKRPRSRPSARKAPARLVSTSPSPSTCASRTVSGAIRARLAGRRGTVLLSSPPTARPGCISDDRVEIVAVRLVAAPLNGQVLDFSRWPRRLPRGKKAARASCLFWTRGGLDQYPVMARTNSPKPSPALSAAERTIAPSSSPSRHRSGNRTPPANLLVTLRLRRQKMTDTPSTPSLLAGRTRPRQRSAEPTWGLRRDAQRGGARRSCATCST